MEQYILDRAQKWLDGNYDEQTKQTIREMMANDPKELSESFYQDLEFGTGGLFSVLLCQLFLQHR